MNTERIKLLEKYIKDEPDNPFNKYALAMEHYESNPDLSLEILRSVLTKHPDYLPTYFKAAHLLWDGEEWDKAEVVFQNGIELATRQANQKALQELTSAYQNFQIDKD